MTIISVEAYMEGPNSCQSVHGTNHIKGDCEIDEATAVACQEGAEVEDADAADSAACAEGTEYVEPEACDPKNANRDLKRMEGKGEGEACVEDESPEFEEKPAVVLNVGDKRASKNSKETREAAEGDIKPVESYTLNIVEDGVVVEEEPATYASNSAVHFKSSKKYSYSYDDQGLPFGSYFNPKPPKFIGEFNSSPSLATSYDFVPSKPKPAMAKSSEMKLIKLCAFDVHAPAEGGEASRVEVYDADGNLVKVWFLEEGQSEKVLEVPEGAKIVAKAGECADGDGTETDKYDNFRLEVYEEKKKAAEDVAQSKGEEKASAEAPAE